MTVDIVQHSLTDLDRGGAGAFVTAGWDWWNRTRGNLSRYDDDLEALLPQMQLDVITDPDQGPRILFIGPYSPTAIVFGTDWAKCAAGKPGIPDSDFGRAVIDFYWHVMSGQEPAYHEICGTVRPPNRPAFRINYRRLIVPCHLRTGAPVLAGFSEFVEPAGGGGARGLGAPSKSGIRLH